MPSTYEYIKKWRKKNPHKAREYWLRWRAQPGYQRKKREEALWRNHRVRWDEAVAMLEAQGGRCALCGVPIALLKERGKRCAHVDHCHETNVVRGLLCVLCNTALGRFGDTVEKVRRVVAYLERADDRQNQNRIPSAK